MRVPLAVVELDAIGILLDLELMRREQLPREAPRLAVQVAGILHRIGHGCGKRRVGQVRTQVLVELMLRSVLRQRGIRLRVVGRIVEQRREAPEPEVGAREETEHVESRVGRIAVHAGESWCR